MTLTLYLSEEGGVALLDILVPDEISRTVHDESVPGVVAVEVLARVRVRKIDLAILNVRLRVRLRARIS